ncbi:MAG: 50S ribosomal protein L17 [bacterium]|nr:50S ribosomal protein L17 [bacterium]
MRHRKSHRMLNRPWKSRMALIRTQARQVLQHRHIVTTDAKAKEVQAFLEPLLTKLIAGGQHNLRLVEAEINDRQLLFDVTTNVVPHLAGRPGGYTSIIKMAPRRGDGTPRSLLQINLPQAVTVEETEDAG